MSSKSPPDRIAPSPSLHLDQLIATPAESVWDVLQSTPDAVRPYGFGKVAFRDGLAMLDPPDGGTVLLPSYVPDGVVEPVRDLGLEPRFYAIEDDLGPALPDVRQRLDSSTVAAMAVHYFGVPARRFEPFRTLLEERGVPLVDDNAHGALSSLDGRLLGTHGVFGFTSLRKLLPVPNGAVLYRSDESELDPTKGRFETTEVAPGVGDLRFGTVSLLQSARRYSRVFDSVLRGVRTGSKRLRGLAVSDGTQADGSTRHGTDSRDPSAIYRRAKVPMSAATELVASGTSAGEVVGARREAFAAWRSVAESSADLDPVFDELRAGVCPQVYPVIAADPEGTVESLRSLGVRGISTWPPLPNEVRGADAYPTANALASRLLRLPTHQDVEPLAISVLAGKL